MSDLQIGLISLGIVLILIVLIFNWWQDRRVRGKLREHFPEADQDPLMGGLSPVAGRLEPGLKLAPPSDPHTAAAVDVEPPSEAVIAIGFAHPRPSAQMHPAPHSPPQAPTQQARVIS